MQHLQKTGGPALRHSGAQPCARSGHPHPPAPHSYPHGSLSTDHGSPCHIGISPKLPTGKPSNPQTNGQSPPLLHCPPMARQRLGQHFLADLHWREEIARAIRVSPHSTVPLPRDDQHCWIEIGSGHGEMTQHLVATDAPVHAIEIDPAIFPTTSPRRSFIASSTSPISSTKSTSSSRTKSLFDSPRNPARAITAIFPSSPSFTRAPNSSSKSLAMPSIRRRKSRPRWSRSACPASAQNSRSAPACRQQQARRRTPPAAQKLVSWTL